MPTTPTPVTIEPRASATSLCVRCASNVPRPPQIAPVPMASRPVPTGRIHRLRKAAGPADQRSQRLHAGTAAGPQISKNASAINVEPSTKSRGRCGMFPVKASINSSDNMMIAIAASACANSGRLTAGFMPSIAHERNRSIDRAAGKLKATMPSANVSCRTGVSVNCAAQIKKG